MDTRNMQQLEADLKLAQSNLASAATAAKLAKQKVERAEATRTRQTQIQMTSTENHANAITEFDQASQAESDRMAEVTRIRDAMDLLKNKATGGVVA